MSINVFWEFHRNAPVQLTKSHPPYSAVTPSLYASHTFPIRQSHLNYTANHILYIQQSHLPYTPKKISDEPVQKVFWTGSLFLNRFMVNIHRGNSVQSGSHNISTFEPVQTWYFSYTWVLNRFTVFEPVQAYEPVHNIGSNTEFLSIKNWKTILRCNIPAVARC